jgi:hypothetical protein
VYCYITVHPPLRLTGPDLKNCRPPPSSSFSSCYSLHIFSFAPPWSSFISSFSLKFLYLLLLLEVPLSPPSPWSSFISSFSLKFLYLILLLEVNFSSKLISPPSPRS